jgi:hypothetical protein
VHKRYPTQKKGLKKINPFKMERVRKLELPTLCLASIKSPGEAGENL